MNNSRKVREALGIMSQLQLRTGGLQRDKLLQLPPLKKRTALQMDRMSNPRMTADTRHHKSAIPICPMFPSITRLPWVRFAGELLPRKEYLAGNRLIFATHSVIAVPIIHPSGGDHPMDPLSAMLVAFILKQGTPRARPLSNGLIPPPFLHKDQN